MIQCHQDGGWWLAMTVAPRIPSSSAPAIGFAEPRCSGQRYSATLSYRPWKSDNGNFLLYDVSICRHKLRQTNSGDILRSDWWILKSRQQLPSKYAIRNHYLRVRHPIVIYEQQRVSTDRKSHTKQNKKILYYIIYTSCLRCY